MRFPSLALPFVVLPALLGVLALPVSAQTLTFDTLASEPGVAGAGFFAPANGGSRTLSGVTFNAAAHSDWEIVGNQYKAPSSSDFFAASHSGDYALAGNAFVGVDDLGQTYTGLTISTNKLLKSLYVGFDNNGGGSNDADMLTLTAFGAGGDLASETLTLTGPALALTDTSGLFGSLTGVTGYRFETTAADLLNAGFGRAYVIADDLTFGAPIPEASPAASLGLLLILGLGGVLVAGRRPTPGTALATRRASADPSLLG